MASVTSNYNLNKPLENEKVNISVINQNMDIIDTNLKLLSDGINEVKSDIPSTDELVSKSTLNTTLSNYAKKSELPYDYLTNTDKTELITAISTAKSEAIETVLGDGVKTDFDTLKEVSDWIQSDTTSSAELITRVSTLESTIGDKADSSSIPTKISQLTNDKGYLTSDDVEIHPNKTVLDKLTQDYLDKIDGIADGAEQNVQSDWNAVSGDAFIKNKPEFADVAISGSYNDLVDKPTIPSSYIHPSYTAKQSGLYKVTVDDKGHVSATTAVTKEDITALGIPENDTDTVYTHPTTAGNKHIPSGGSSGQILEWSASGTAKWVTPNFSSSSGTTVYKQTSEPTVSDTAVWIPI